MVAADKVNLHLPDNEDLPVLQGYRFRQQPHWRCRIEGYPYQYHQDLERRRNYKRKK